jgi:hypothetical protein
MEPAICAASKRAKRMGVMALVNSIANVTAGLKRPPEMRKKIQTLTMRENANTRAMYYDSSATGMGHDKSDAYLKDRRAKTGGSISGSVGVVIR